MRGSSELNGSCSTIWASRRNQRSSRGLPGSIDAVAVAHLPRRRPVEPEQDAHERRLARSRLADDAQAAALLERHVDTVERRAHRPRAEQRGPRQRVLAADAGRRQHDVRLAASSELAGVVVRRLADDARRRAALDDAAVAHHDDVVDHAGHEGDVVADEDRAPCRPRRRAGASSSMISACTVTSSAVVGSSAISSAGRQASAMAMPTRWRWPPESWCGYGAHDAVRIGQADPLAQLLGRDGGGTPTETSVQTQRLGDLPPDRASPG